MVVCIEIQYSTTSSNRPEAGHLLLDCFGGLQQVGDQLFIDVDVAFVLCAVAPSRS